MDTHYVLPRRSGKTTSLINDAVKVAGNGNNVIVLFKHDIPTSISMNMGARIDNNPNIAFVKVGRMLLGRFRKGRGCNDLCYIFIDEFLSFDQKDLEYFYNHIMNIFRKPIIIAYSTPCKQYTISEYALANMSRKFNLDFNDFNFQAMMSGMGVKCLERVREIIDYKLYNRQSNTKTLRANKIVTNLNQISFPNLSVLEESYMFNHRKYMNKDMWDMEIRGVFLNQPDYAE